MRIPKLNNYKIYSHSSKRCCLLELYLADPVRPDQTVNPEVPNGG